MSRFHVGQRVRIVYAPSKPHLVGEETRITGVAHGAWEQNGYDWMIGKFHDGVQLGANDYHLEPILPSGSAPSEFRTLAELLDDLGTKLPA